MGECYKKITLRLSRISKMNKKRQWPNFFPTDVPPKEATPANGYAFRIVKNIPPSESDFVCTLKEYPNRKASTDDKTILLYGTSFSRQLECIKKTRDRYGALRDRHIVAGTLENRHGFQLSTGGQSHLTVWIYQESHIHLDFTLNAEAI
jgi:hypothetical protein